MRYRPFSRREHRRLLLAWAGRNAWPIAGLVLGVVVVVAFETVLILTVASAAPWRWYFLGVVHAVIVCAAIGLVWSAFHAHEGGAIHQLRGAWGEDNTRDELRRAKRKRLIWGWVDSITVSTGDIDHLVVTRRGGLVAIDSKWRSADQVLDAHEMRDSASRARRRAEGVVARYLPKETGQHRTRGPAHRVAPLVVVWGKAQHSIPVGARIDDVSFVGGRRLHSWLRDLDGEPIDRRAGRELVRQLELARAEAWGVTTAAKPSASARGA